MDFPTIDPLIAAGVVASTAITDAVYVFFNAAVSERRRIAAASWSSIWYLLSAFAVISYTSNWAYVLFAAVGAWIGGFLSITALTHVAPLRGGKRLAQMREEAKTGQAASAPTTRDQP
ncbi:hypothetical protein LG047_03465 [Methylocystis sp. WRRC1]|uniref:hypothetical protein n=1 Tax=unclassified Methylocystis TaxID=2625913 RepID=UPI0001F87C87|nr:MULTISPECIES: hypothetical protein [unclassified Methylocystis]MCC3244391.1 hypothetical protein [Methylocystis sp. WRRC1]